jgi:alkylation response protein AidB-like acyl-CoA dehydrogenase
LLRDAESTPSAAAPAGGSDAISLILAQAGRKPEEIASLATLDDADRTAEGQFSGEAPTLATLFGTAQAADLDAGRFSPAPEVAATMAACLEFVMARKKEGTLLDHERMLFHADTISGLAARGFFGLAIPKQYGGSGAKLGDLGPLLRALTLVHPDLAVMFEVHNFLGPVTPLLDFGTAAQKDRYLPKMARGELLGSFALTEPGAGADPSRLSMTARRDGDRWLVSGVKWPITNVLYGGLCILVLKLEEEGLPAGRDSAMLIFEVPRHDTDHFTMIRNRLNAFDYLWNARFRLTDCPVPVDNLLGPPGKGLAQAFSSLAKGRGGICVNSAVKIFRIIAQLSKDPAAQGAQAAQAADPRERSASATRDRGGWLSFRSTFGRPLGEAPKSLLEMAIRGYQVQGGRSVHVDERREAARRHERLPAERVPIENYIGENMHEFAIATVYEGPNPVLADVGAPNAMTRGIRTRYLEPIGLAEAKGSFGLVPKAAFGLFVAKTVLGSFLPWQGSLEGLANLTPSRRKWIGRGFRRNRVLGRRILLVIARYQRSFIEESFLLGDEGGVFEQLCASTAALAYAIALADNHPEYKLVAEALDLEAESLLRGRSPTSALQRLWAEIGRLVIDPASTLHRDLIADIEVSQIPLDPRSVGDYI